MSGARAIRVGVLGAGTIGRELITRLGSAGVLGLELAFAWSRDPGRLDGLVRPDRRLARLDPATIHAARPDLVVETAHPALVRDHAARILEVADLLPLSVTALVDDALRAELEAVAARCGHRLLLPHGALVGAAALAAIGPGWRRVTFRMEKPPASLVPADGPLPAATLMRTIVHDGSVRAAALRFPRNVNAMVAGALVTIGPDLARAVLVADPARTDLLLEVDAVAADGARLRIRRRQPASGVSGTEMGASAWASVLAATGRAPSGAIV
jgi:aspartate dehydrogenase